MKKQEKSFTDDAYQGISPQGPLDVILSEVKCLWIKVNKWQLELTHNL